MELPVPSKGTQFKDETSADNYFLNLWRVNRDLFYSILASYSFNQIEKIINSILPQVKNDYNFWAALYRARFGKTLNSNLKNYPEAYHQELIVSKFRNLGPHEFDILYQEDEDEDAESRVREILENPELSYLDLQKLIDNVDLFQVEVAMKAIETDDIDLYLFAKQNEIPIGPPELKLLLEGDHRDLVEDYLEALDEEQFREFLLKTPIRVLVSLPTKKSQEEQDCNLDLLKAKFALKPKIGSNDYAEAIYGVWSEDCSQALDYLFENVDILDEKRASKFAQKLVRLSTEDNNLELIGWVISKYGLSVFNFGQIEYSRNPGMTNTLFQTYPDQFENYFYELIEDQQFRLLNEILSNIVISPELADELLRDIAQQENYSNIKQRKSLIFTIGSLLTLVPTSVVDRIIEESDNPEFKDLIISLASE